MAMALRLHLPPRFRNLLLTVGIIFILLFLVGHAANLNFAAYGIGASTSALEVTLRPDSPPFPNPWTTLSSQTHEARLNETYGHNIPNIINFVYILPKGVQDFSFKFKNVLAFYGAWLYNDPDVIYLHTNADAAAISRARSGKLGKWNALIFNIPQLVIQHAEAPDAAANGVAIKLMPHKSDFVRAAALEAYGGVYLDSDAIPLRDLRPLLETGFNTVLGRQLDGVMMSGNFIGKAHCRFFTRWIEEMHKVYDQRWVTHSNDAMTRVARELAGRDREILVMEPPTMNAVHWKGMHPLYEGTQAFYSVHTDVRSNLEGLADGDPLKDFDGGKEGRPKWERDYSEAYILHSWHEERGVWLPHGFDHVTPRYILERRSDFSRAVYPIAKHLYENGFIKFDDPWRYVVQG